MEFFQQSVGHGGGHWLARLACDQKDIGWNPASTNLLQIRPASLKPVRCQNTLKDIEMEQKMSPPLC